jgi:hypothetical protein
MKSRAGSEKAMASGLKARVDLSLVTRGDGRLTSPNRAHSKSGTDANVVPNLSGAAQARALRLARRLASSHSG